MAYAGLSGLGYPNMVLTHHIEIVLATVVCLLHTVFYAYVLGTLVSTAGPVATVWSFRHASRATPHRALLPPHA